jgi:hypothetical protein
MVTASRGRATQVGESRMSANETNVGEQSEALEGLLDIKIAHIFVVLFCSMAGITLPLYFKSKISPATTFLLRAFAAGNYEKIGSFRKQNIDILNLQV